ncbi:hypothetical protein L7F22_069209 [Adiantum nelumboides]|nr:hypothetical protein [Adiantum nelumboides]
MLEGPLTEPYCTEEDRTGRLNPTWETPFTVSLCRNAQLTLTVLIKRRVHRDKPIARVELSLKDFARPDGGSHEYSLILCRAQGAGAGAQPAVLRMSARLLGGGCQHRRPQTPPPPAAPPPAVISHGVRGSSSDVSADDDYSDSDDKFKVSDLDMVSLLAL